MWNYVHLNLLTVVLVFIALPTIQGSASRKSFSETMQELISKTTPPGASAEELTQHAEFVQIANNFLRHEMWYERFEKRVRDGGYLWNATLIPATTAISVMCDLITTVAEKPDFPLHPVPVDDSIKYLKHPESFRASVAQIHQTALDAFMLARDNMAAVRFYAHSMPQNVQDAVRILSSRNVSIISPLLPIFLQRLENEQKQIIALLVDAISSFEHLLRLTAETIDGVVGAQELAKSTAQEDKIQQGNESLQVLKKLEGDWTEVMTYFDFVIMNFGSSQRVAIRSFQRHVQDWEKLSDVAYLAKTFQKAMAVNEEAYCMYIVADVCAKLADRYLVTKFAKLNQLMNFDSKTATRSMIQLRLEMREVVREEAFMTIMTFVITGSEDALKLLQSRTRSLDNQFLGLLNQTQTKEEVQPDCGVKSELA